MMDEKGDLYSPMVGLDFVVYRIPSRLARGHSNYNGPWAVRLGPRARGSLTQRLRAPKKMPPGTRNASSCGNVQFSGSLLQMGYPASMNTDACLGISVMAHQSWGIVYGHCEAWQSTFVRIEGRLSKGRDRQADGLCQRANVCYSPGCACATHVAGPPPYSLGPLDSLERTGIRL